VRLAEDARVRRIVVWASSFNISSDRRWIAWSKTGGPDTPDTVGVVPSTGGECLLVPRPSDRADSLAFFKPGLKRVFFFLREPFSATAGQAAWGRIISVPMSSLRRAPASASEGGVRESPLSDGPHCGAA